MTAALGVVETVFTFAEDGISAGYFWEQPQNKLGPKDMFYALAANMGDTLLSTVQQLGVDPANVNWRIYVSQQSGQEGRIAIWGLNFSDNEDTGIGFRHAVDVPYHFRNRSKAAPRQPR